MFGFWRDQTESTVPAAGAAVVVMPVRAHRRAGVVMVVLLAIVLHEFQETAGRCRRTAVVVRVDTGASAVAAATGRGHGGRRGGRRRRRRTRSDDGRRRRPLDRHAKVDRCGHCHLHRGDGRIGTRPTVCASCFDYLFNYFFFFFTQNTITIQETKDSGFGIFAGEFSRSRV